ncbi:MAG: ubiquinol-cytochrome c reductase iron-sulfur subunit [Bryobacterales bacterium]|nr:ubiquinol-cytochrome c reductase iron-sulfur subunit [Bryobacterales bacterium]
MKSLKLLAGKEGSSRRTFFRRLGLGALFAALAGQAYALLRSLVPNVLYEQPQKFKIGTPSEFPEGVTFLEDRRVYVFRDQNTFHTVSAVCTHLGCTVKMVNLNQPRKVAVGGREIEEAQEFHCPCHGSKYYGDGTNYAGPAPKPLACFQMEVSPDDGQLQIDLGQTVGRDVRLSV